MEMKSQNKNVVAKMSEEGKVKLMFKLILNQLPSSKADCEM